MKWLSILLLIACSTRSNDPQPIQPPTVETILISFNDTLAIVRCKSSSPLHGICWGAPNPTKANNWADGDTVEINTVPRKEYSVRAYAQNGAGTFYGETIKFKAICPSDLGGIINYTTQLLSTDGPLTCPVPITGTTTLTDKGDGIYLIGDASFGVYACAWGDSPAVGVSLQDTCGKLEFIGKDQYGLIFTMTVISKNPLIIQWGNNYGDSGITTIQ